MSEERVSQLSAAALNALQQPNERQAFYRCLDCDSCVMESLTGAQRMVQCATIQEHIYEYCMWVCHIT